RGLMEPLAVGGVAVLSRCTASGRLVKLPVLSVRFQAGTFLRTAMSLRPDCNPGRCPVLPITSDPLVRPPPPARPFAVIGQVTGRRQRGGGLLSQQRCCTCAARPGLVVTRLGPKPRRHGHSRVSRGGTDTAA